MDAGLKIRELRKQYGGTLRIIRRAEGLERAVRRGAPRTVIERKKASYEQVIIQFRGTTNGVSMGRKL